MRRCWMHRSQYTGHGRQCVKCQEDENVRYGTGVEHLLTMLYALPQRGKVYQDIQRGNERPESLTKLDLTWLSPTQLEW